MNEVVNKSFFEAVKIAQALINTLVNRLGIYTLHNKNLLLIPSILLIQKPCVE